MSLPIPASLKGDHESLLSAVRRGMREPGRTGEAARHLAQLLDGHMMREEKFVFRPLGLLPSLARGETPAGLAEAENLCLALKDEIAQMRGEHRQISDALRELAAAAQAEGKAQYVAFAEDLVRHHHLEEDVLYPAALLVGEFAKRVRTAGEG